MNAYVQWVKRKLDDPATPTAEYRAAWNEWQAIVFEQNVITHAAERRAAGSRITPATSE